MIAYKEKLAQPMPEIIFKFENIDCFIRICKGNYL